QGLIYKENGDPRGKLEGHVWDIDTKNLKEGEIFVKIGHASVNPADFNVIQGVYPAKPEKQKLPGIEEEVWIGGNEGFGVVEKLSENGDLNGLKRGDWVIFSKPQIGTWRSGLICNANDVIKIPNRKESQITPYMASTLQVNPATAYRMLHDFHQLDPKKDVIVQNAANSAVGQAVAQIASRKLKVASINFIRSNAYSEELQKAFDSYSKGDESCKAYLFSYEHLADRNSGLKERIKTILGDRQIKLGLNAVCGQANADMAKLMSTNSTLITYGAMSRQPLTVPAGLIIFQNMAIRGFMMNKWYAQNGLKEREELLKTLV
ncbi:GroES-like protein, partial [Meira miltonrushii]